MSDIANNGANSLELVCKELLWGLEYSKVSPEIEDLLLNVIDKV